MKTCFCLFAALPLFVAGCGEGSSSRSPEAGGSTNASGNPITAPVDYLGAVGQGHKSAVTRIDTASLNHAIQLFQVEHGRYPRDLNELVREKVIGQIPPAPHGMKIVYDAVSGQVQVVKQ